MKKIEIGPTDRVGARAKEDTLALTYDSFKEFGDYFKIQVMPGLSWYVISDPAAVEHIIVKNNQNYRKPKIFIGALSHLCGKGVITGNPEEAAQARKQIIPFTQTRSVDKMADQIRGLYEKALAEKLPADVNQIEIFEFMLQLNFRVYTELFMGEDLSMDSQMGKKLYSLFDYVHMRMHNPLYPPAWFPTPATLKFKKTKAEVDEYLWQAVINRAKPENRREDLLSRLLEPYTTEAEVLSKKSWLIDQMHNLLFPAHDTLGTAFGWITHLLSQYPETQSKVREDFAAGSFAYYKQVMNECLRLYPTAWSIPRVALKDDVVNGHLIPKGKMVIVSQYVIHRHPRYWDSPEEFQPERFANFDPIKQRYSYFPFGIGTRMCVGNNLAMALSKELFGLLLKNYDLQAIEKSVKVEILSTSSLRAKHGVQLRVSRRVSKV